MTPKTPKKNEYCTIKVRESTKKRLLLIKAAFIITSGGGEEPTMDKVINGIIDRLPKAEITAIIEGEG